jgi:transposase InsO family protein
MKDHFTIPELAALGLPDMPQTRRGIAALAAREGWHGRPTGRKGGGIEYPVSCLPEAARLRLEIVQSAGQPDTETKRRSDLKAHWARYHALSGDQKRACEQRFQAVQLALDGAKQPGVTLNAAAAMAALQHGVSVRSIFNWLDLVRGCERHDWLAILAPNYATTDQRSDCHPDAWAYLKSDYLRPEGPKFSACYRRMVKVAAKEGWSPVASEASLRRRLHSEVPKAVQVLAREGRDKAKTLYPAQRRSRAHLHAMEAVNMDGHQLDVFVRVPWSDKPVRMHLLGIQDLYSGKIVAWRLTDAENKETVRLVIGDMVENWGIPDRMTLDNGRAFASKWITGGSKTRYRFKVRDEDPRGLVTTLGIETDWTLPYSGQSKPIERAWGDLAENISKHPFCAGAYTGTNPQAKPENYMSRAIPLDDFRRHVDAQIAEHNARTGRRGGVCDGRSFDETFAASLAEPGTIVRVASTAQRALWLLASEVIQARKGSGEIHYHGNRYWNRALNQFAGKKVTIRFDPDRLHDPVKVYDLDNRLICEAECIADVGFHSAEAARRTAKARNEFLKAQAAERKAHAALSARELGDLYYKGEAEQRPAEAAPPTPPKVRRIVTGNLAIRQDASPIADEDFESNFSKALGKIAANASIIQFPRGNEPVSSEYGSEKKGGGNPAR